MALQSSSGTNWRGNVRRRVPFYRRRWFAVLVILFLVGGITALAVMLAAVIEALREQAETFLIWNALQKNRAAPAWFTTAGATSWGRRPTC